MNWRRWLPYWRWMMVSATVLLAIIGANVMRLYREYLIAEWVVFLYGIVTITLLAVFVMTALFYRDPDPL